MSIYTFHLFKSDGACASLVAFELSCDGDTFAKANDLLTSHFVTERVEVWQGDRAVAALYRDQPVIRPVEVEPARLKAG